MRADSAVRSIHREGGPLSYAAFRRMLLARLVSGLGSWMQTVAAGYLVFKLTGDAMAVGVLAAIALAPSLIGAPIGGALADRFCPRKLTTTFFAILILPPLALSILAFSDELTVSSIYLCVALLAVVHSVNQPIFQIVIPFTVPERLRRQAVADVSATYNVAQLVGAVLGGTVVALVGPGFAFLANALSYLFVTLMMIASPVLQRSCDLARHRNDGEQPETGKLRRGFGLEVVRVAAAGAGCFFLFVAPVEQLMPTIAAEHGDDAMYLGLLLAAICLGAILGNPLVRKRAIDGSGASSTLTTGVIACGPVVLLLALSSTLVTDLVLLVALGICWEMIFVSGSTSLQLDVPPEIKGKMIGFFYVLVSGCAALGALLLGYLFDLLGIDTSLTVSAGVIFVVGVGLLGFRRFQMRNLE